MNSCEGADLAKTNFARVGIVRQPPLWMKAGDVIRVEIDGLGELRNAIIDEPDSTAIPMRAVPPEA